jgi:hypothetical protein
MSKLVIESYEDFPYGSYTTHPMTNSSNGYPPKLNPERGDIYIPDTEDEHNAYPALASKLTNVINAFIPEETHALVQFESRLQSTPVAAEMYSLSTAAFKLDYYIDSNHPLLKIATLTDFREFEAAVLAL